MKRIIEIDEKDYNLVYDLISGVEPEFCRDRVYKAIANGTPYNPSGDAISRELLKKDIEAQISDFNELNKKGEPYKDFKDIRAILFGLVIGKNLIDNAPPVFAYTEDDMNGATVDGYDVGYKQAKEDAMRRIVEQYSEHNKRIPKWLSIGDMKGGTE